MASKPQLGFYRSSSALQVNFIAPQFTMVNNNKYFSKHGFLLLEGALGSNKTMDWNNKISFAIGIGDLPHLLEEFHKWKFSRSKDINVKLDHDPHAQSDKAGKIFKKLTITKKMYKDQPQWVLNLSSNEAEKPFYIYLSEGEMLLIGELLFSMPTYLLGIDKIQERYESQN